MRSRHSSHRPEAAVPMSTFGPESVNSLHIVVMASEHPPYSAACHGATSSCFRLKYGLKGRLACVRRARRGTENFMNAGNSVTDQGQCYEGNVVETDVRLLISV
jgi:hypothetical protein